MTVTWNGVYPAATTQFVLDESFDLNDLNATAVCRQNFIVMQKTTRFASCGNVERR